MQLPTDRESFHGLDPLVATRSSQDEAAADERAIEHHRARPALPLLAGVLAAGELELLAEEREQRLAVARVGRALLAVHGERDFHQDILATRASARAPMTAST